MPFSSIEIHFGAPVELSDKHQQELVGLVDRICKEYEASHPARVMWPSGVGFKPTYIPLTREEEEHRGMEFAEDIFSVDCFEREDYDWKCARCGLLQGDHKECIVDPPAGECEFTTRNA
jgi:hypothetical protein